MTRLLSLCGELMTPSTVHLMYLVIMDFFIHDKHDTLFLISLNFTVNKVDNDTMTMTHTQSKKKKISAINNRVCA